MSARGTYRPVYERHPFNQSFLSMSKHAKLLWFLLKTQLGPSGIDVCLSPTLAALGSLAPEDAEGGLLELEESGWIEREGSIIWLIGGLGEEPHLSSKQAKHKRSIQRHLDGLCALAITRRFREHYREWFADDPQAVEPGAFGRAPSLADGTTDAIGSPMTDGLRVAPPIRREDEVEQESFNPPPALLGSDVPPALQIVPGGSEVVARFLERVPRSQSREYWLAKLGGWLEGQDMPLGRHAPAAALVAALSDYASETGRDYSPKHVRGFVLRELRAKRVEPSSRATQTRATAARVKPATYGYPASRESEGEVTWQS